MFNGKISTQLSSGASSGIGYGTALRFAKEGATLTLTGRNSEALAKLVTECTKTGLAQDKILTVQGDIVDEKVREKIINETVNKFGRIDILVNNAGEFESESFSLFLTCSAEIEVLTKLK